jgi:hypothetical protein
MGSGKNQSKSLKIAYWITTAIVSIVFFVTGIGNLVPFEHIAKDMVHLGYPFYFLKILGTWKILAALTIILPRMSRIKEWAYAGMILDLTGAAFSRFTMGDGFKMVIIPIAIAIIVTVSYVLRMRNASSIKIF